jgi:hypothetical protein
MSTGTKGDYEVGYGKPPRGAGFGPPVRLRAPRGVSHVQLFSGIHRAVAPDGAVEMTESDAEPLSRAGWVRSEAGDHASSAN